MDENELRLAAVELLVMERLALDDPGKLQALSDEIRKGLPDTRPIPDVDEYTIRLQALQIIDDAVHRHDLFATGFRIKKT